MNADERRSGEAQMPHNPSAWSDRLPLIALALAGLGISMYLGLYQLGVFPHVWEPFFGNGSEKVLHSAIAKLFPFPDAFLGAAGYAAEVILTSIGGEERWRTHPWIVAGMGCVATGMAVVSLILLICQPAVANAWCTLCLCSAFISFCIVGPALHEFRAAYGVLKNRGDLGHGLRSTAH